ncbi:MAG: hydrolase Nlp/P60 [Flavobacterium sp.]|nr:MAG: hydrolase Nlp/P60 [Flavobacterium sp.]
MNYGLCNLSIVPLRSKPSDTSEMISQVLYGDLFEIIETTKKWSFIRLEFDDYEGWIDNKQMLPISETDFHTLQNLPKKYATNLVDIITTSKNELLPISLGSNVTVSDFLKHTFEGEIISEIQAKGKLIETALTYLNSPYLWGGKTPFGIDCSGFTQMAYKINGYKLLRDASLQASQGEVLSFIEESEPGDLAFFDNEEGNITHVGIIMENNLIIHASGKVRIDQLDHSGIFNLDTKKHTHKLRVIKRIIE